MKTLESLSEEVKGDFTWESLAALFTERTGKSVSCTTVYNSCKAASWRQVCERYVPCLNAKDVARRLEWAKQHLDYTWTGTENLRYPNVFNKKVGWIDIDEKWWDMLKKRLMKVHPGQQRRTRVQTKSKRFVQKVMGLCAVARPCGDFNGRLGMYQCARKKVAERNSKYHERGDVYDEDCEVNGDMFYEIVTKQLFPDIYDKMADFDFLTLERCWDVKTAVAKRILDANETNDCKLPHGIKHEERVSVNLSLDSDDTDDPVARTLDYDRSALRVQLLSLNISYILRPCIVFP